MSDEANSYPRREFLGRIAAVPALAALAAQWRPSPVFGQTVTEQVLAVPQLPETELAREVESLMRFVDPKIAYRHVPIDAERNAWPLWKRAAEIYVKEPDAFADDDALHEFIEGGPPPSGQLLEDFRRWMQKNEPARRLTDEGIAKGEFELPRATKSIAIDIDTDAPMALRDLAQLKCAHCQLLLLENLVDDALAEAQGIARMAEILRNAESLVVDYLIASTIQGVATCAAYSVALHRKATRSHGETAIALLNTGPDREDFLRSLRVEFCRWFLPELARIPRTTDPAALATALLTPHWSANYQPSKFELARLERTIADTARVLRGHPRPFDREATVRLANDLQLQWFAELNTSYWKRTETCFGALTEEMSVWPQFACNSILPFSEDENSPAETRPIEGEIERARQALGGIDNIVGKRFVSEQYEVRSHFLVEIYEVRLKSLQLRIALPHFERAHGELPASLDALVEDGWFAAVPTDPYDGQPFRYARGERLIWSVGKDGDNDPLGKDRLESTDAFEHHLKEIWKIPSQPTT